MITELKMNHIHEDVEKQITKLIYKITVQISKDNDISINKLNESVEKILGTMNENKKICKGFIKSTNRPCTVELKPGHVGDYCRRHTNCGLETCIPVSEPIQCIAITNKSTRCPNACVTDKGYCRKHYFGNTANETINFNPSKRKCLHSEVDDNGDLIRCDKVVNKKFYTCDKHRQHEDLLKNDYNLEINAIEFQKLFMENKISTKFASLIFGNNDNFIV